MERSKDAGPDRSRDSDSVAAQVADNERRRTRSNNSYDGDNSANNSDNDDPPSDNGWTPVVTFAEAPKKSPASSRARLSAGIRHVGSGHRTQSAVSLDSRQPTPGSLSARVRGHHRRSKRAARERSGELSSTRSFPALNTMASEKGVEPGMTPLNTPAPAAAAAAGAAAEPASEVPGLQGRRDASPQSARLSMSLRNSITPGDGPAIAPISMGYPTTPLAQHAFPLCNSSESSSDESARGNGSSSSSSALEDMWFQRARTFSIQNPEEPDTQPHTAQSPGSIRTLPRVLTVTSAKEKDGDGNGGNDDDDLPPLRFGREVTNDLRNIQLTFSREPDDKGRSKNPLKHIIRSKHNFRALVTYGGYLIPINILLNVILLGRGWLQYNEPNAEGVRDTVSNPLGYLITSIISLVLIVTSGLCFILRCLEFDVMLTTVMSIVANFINAVIILASAIMYAKNERPKHPDARLTGEFYCSYAGAAVALLDAMLLLLDVLVTPGFRYRGSGMSRPQRLLQFNVIVVVVWIGIGGYVWSKIEPWDTITSIMFCMITVTTIGFGNITPSKTYSRILQLVYSPPGIIMFGLMLLNTRNVIVQITRSKFRTAKRDFEAKRRKIEQELAEEHVKRRLAVHPERRNLRSMFTDMMSRVFLSHNQRARAGVPHWLRNRFDEEEVHDMEATHAPFSAPTYATEDQHVPDTAEQHNITFAESSSREQSAPAQETTDIADGHPDDDQAPHAMGRTYTTASRVSQICDALARPGKLQNVRRRIGLGGRRKKSKEGDGDSATDGYDSDDSDEGETGLDVSQTIQPDGADSPKPGRLDRVLSVASNVRDRVKSRAQGRGKRKTGPRDTAKQLWVALIINVGFWVMSAGIFYATERARWNYFDAMWFCYVAFTTIGYGDYVPITTEGMVAFICLCFVAVGLETFLVVSAVSFFTDLLNRAMKRTRVQKRIAKHRKSLAAYEIRRHIKHPNYNPFSRGDEDNMFAVGFRRFKRWLQHMGDILHGRRSVGDAFTRHRTKDQRERDERLTEGFIRHTTGMGGFAATTWHPPSRTQSFVSTPSVGRRPTSQSVAVFPPHVSTAPHTAVSMPPPDQLRRMQTDSTQSERSASISSAPEDFLWAFF